MNPYNKGRGFLIMKEVTRQQATDGNKGQMIGYLCV